MTRKRKAILIESGLISLAPPLLGAAQDVKNWEKYLKTFRGGCWNEPDDEIVPLSKPSKDDLKAQLTTLSCYEYAFITFSGHGGHNDAKSEDFIFLNDKEIITVNEIVDLVSAIDIKATIIMDACRKCMTPPNCFEYSDYRKHGKSLLESVQIPKVQYNRKVLLEDASLKSYDNSRPTDVDEFQNKWWKILDSKPKEIFLLQSCSQNELSSEGLDGEQQFGLFSRSMLDSACKTPYSEELSVNDAFEFARGQVLSNTKNAQNPEINMPCPYPFAVIVD